MATLFSLVWWTFVLGASWQAWKAWGPGTALGALLGLWFGWTLLGQGLIAIIATLGAAVAIGARAETAQQKQLAIYRS